MKRSRVISRDVPRPRSGPTVLDAARAAGLVPGHDVDAPATRPAVPAPEGEDEETPATGLTAVRAADLPPEPDATRPRSEPERIRAEPDGPAVPARPLPAPRPDARPRIVDDTGILGLARVSRGRIGSRLFTWFFVFVFTLIAVQMVVALLTS